jgi:hypothetical protein
VADEPRSCKFCQAPVGPGVLAEGHAVILLGELYCTRCLVSAVEGGRSENVPASPPGVPIPRPVPDGIPKVSESATSAGADQEMSSRAGGPPWAKDSNSPSSAGGERRACSRYVPPFQAKLILRLPGLSGIFLGNLVKFWVEVSEGGLRVIVSRKLSRGDVLRARFSLLAEPRFFSLEVQVRHVSESHRYQGAFLAGFRFIDPAPEFLSWGREQLFRFPAVSGPAPRGKPAPPSKERTA